ncbi:putative MFS sugar transporter [Periconia macrospinosa]|uniref:Putative MFS sugar transporter n=1 Tax=Periconia macrospinosa TaxID=97972 RepID=A0A2V1DB25_9PLEO|nr:putative MFS sugar transporter [Periconia macrospinosa]
MYTLPQLSWPPRYVTASILCSFGGFVFGMDTSVIGPVTVMERYIDDFGAFSSTIHGLIVSSILITAAISSFFAGRIADALGRIKCISLGGLIFSVGAAIQAAASHLGMFVAGRAVEGVGEGFFLGALVVYICEIAPPRQRGPLTSSPQLMTTMGLVSGYFICYGTRALHSSLAWRLPFVLLAALSASFAFSVYFWLPESPRWLSLQGKEADANKVWEALDVNSADREKIILQQGGPETGIALEPTPTATPEDNGRDIAVPSPVSTPKKSALLDAFAPDVRARTLLGIFLMAMQQLSGIDGVLYYAPTLFKHAGLTSSSASFLASGVSAIVIFAVTILALIWADQWGRRQSTIYGGLGLSFLMLLMGSLYAANAVHETSGAGRWIVIVSIYLFAVIFSISWAVGIKIYVAESQPQHTRASATGLAHGSNWVANFLVALTTPVLLERSSFGAYFLFGGCTFATVIVCFLWMEETKGKSLDDAGGNTRLVNVAT